MFAVNILDSNRADGVLQGNKLMLRYAMMSDHKAWAKLRAESEDFLRPWEPAWYRNDLGKYAFRQRLKRYNREIQAGTGYPWLIFDRSNNDLLGGITIGHIKRGVSQSGQIGYWVGAPHAGRGVMSEALQMIVHHAFTRCGLHRLEAACIPSNERSIRLLRKSAFEQEGHVKSYLKINGQWRDHLLFARINTNID